MKTYLNELHNQCKDSRSTNYTSNISTSNRKDEQLSKNKNNNSQNKLIKYKSGLFLLYCICSKISIFSLYNCSIINSAISTFN